MRASLDRAFGQGSERAGQRTTDAATSLARLVMIAALFSSRVGRSALAMIRRLVDTL